MWVGTLEGADRFEVRIGTGCSAQAKILVRFGVSTPSIGLDSMCGISTPNHGELA